MSRTEAAAWFILCVVLVVGASLLISALNKWRWRK